MAAAEPKRRRGKAFPFFTARARAGKTAPAERSAVSAERTERAAAPAEQAAPPERAAQAAASAANESAGESGFSGFVEQAAAAPAFQAGKAAEHATGGQIAGGTEKGKLTLGVAFLVIGTLMFAFQDATTKGLISHYPISFIIMTRCFALALAGFLVAAVSPGGARVNIKTKRPFLQFLRGLFVMSQWLLFAYATRSLGLGETTALYEAYPLFGTILAVFILHEYIGWRRIVGLIIGFCGILVMLHPGAGTVSFAAFCAILGALLFALYVVLTRLVSRSDGPQTSFFYMGAVSTALMLPALPFIWVPVSLADAGWFVLLGIFCVSAHFCIIKALSLAPVTVLQPFNYSQLMWSILVGFIIFGNLPDKYTFIGAGLVVFSGLFVLFRGHMRKPRIFVGANSN